MDLDKMKQSTTRMILQLAVPSIIGMVLTSFITVADGFFIGNYVGKEGIAAVNLGLPVIYLFLGIGLMVSVGGMELQEWHLVREIKKNAIRFSGRQLQRPREVLY